MTTRLDEHPVELYAGQDYADAISFLVHLADPNARVLLEPTGYRLMEGLGYGEDEDWMGEARNLAEAVGKRLLKVRNVWVLAPCCCHS